MIFVYLIVGVLASMFGAIPLGASNIAVINTTLKQNASQALKIALSAAVAEVLLSYYALHFNVLIRNFFKTHLWIQIVIIVILFAVGIFLFFKKDKQQAQQKKKRIQSKYATGFVLGLLNPPVLIYWVIAFGVLNSNNIMLSLNSSLTILILFFVGVYIGKLITLLIYSKFSVYIKHRVQNITSIINKVTGVLLVFIALLQAIKLYVF